MVSTTCSKDEEDEPKLDDTRRAFSPGRRTTDQIFTLQKICESLWGNLTHHLADLTYFRVAEIAAVSFLWIISFVSTLKVSALILIFSQCFRAGVPYETPDLVSEWFQPPHNKLTRCDMLGTCLQPVQEVQCNYCKWVKYRYRLCWWHDKHQHAWRGIGWPLPLPISVTLRSYSSVREALTLQHFSKYCLYGSCDPVGKC